MKELQDKLPGHESDLGDAGQAEGSEVISLDEVRKRIKAEQRRKIDEAIIARAAHLIKED